MRWLVFLHISTPHGHAATAEGRGGVLEALLAS